LMQRSRFLGGMSAISTLGCRKSRAGTQQAW
jgi:hypothetical protein